MHAALADDGPPRRHALPRAATRAVHPCGPPITGSTAPLM
jgi:hypothetical protein